MPENIAKIDLYVTYIQSASHPIWLEAAPGPEAHDELEALRAKVKL